MKSTLQIKFNKIRVHKIKELQSKFLPTTAATTSTYTQQNMIYGL